MDMLDLNIVISDCTVICASMHCKMCKLYPLIMDVFLPQTYPLPSKLLESMSYNDSISTIKHSGMNIGLAIGKQGG